MRHLTILLVALATLLAPGALAAPDATNNLIRSFGHDVTAAESNFTVESKIGISVRVASCNTWLLENDDAVDTIWIRWSEPGATSPTPAAVADPTDVIPNQMRLKPGQSKSLRAFANTRISVIATGDAHLHAEMACPQRN